MEKKVTVLTLSALLYTLCLSAEAQQAKIPRIGYISGTGSASNPGPYVEALRQGLRDLGRIDGKNIMIEYRGAEGKLDLILSLVNELVQLKVDVLVVPILSAARAAKQATKTIPIVMVTGDPVAAGIVDSLARPGGNLTGLATLNPSLSGKRLELLKEVVPQLSRVGVLWVPDDPSTTFEEYKAAARALKVQVQSLEVRGPNLDLDGAFQTAVKGRVNALITVTSAPLFLQRKRIADGNKEPPTYAVSRKRLGRGWWSDVLFDRRSGDISPRRHVRGQNSQRHQAGRLTNRAADEVRICNQSQDSEADRAYDSAVRAVPSR